jgi:UDP-N-acetylglucosamine 2-epimerase (non-hydrolysing)
MVDALLAALPTASKLRNEVLSRVGASESEYVLATAHRAGNVDDPLRLKSIVEALIQTSKKLRVLFPAHPRVLSRLKAFHLIDRLKGSSAITLTKPVGYLEFVALLDTATAVLTDSGGIQKEAFLLGVPCVTMRRVTEWPETVQAGANVLVDANKKKILRAILGVAVNKKPRTRPIYSRNPFGDGKAARRIVSIVLKAY